MRLYGRVMKERYVLTEQCVEDKDRTKPFADRLEGCLIKICRRLDVSVPIWLDKNTTEFACFRKTSFMADQFMDEVKFDRLEIQIELD